MALTHKARVRFPDWESSELLSTTGRIANDTSNFEAILAIQLAVSDVPGINIGGAFLKSAVST